MIPMIETCINQAIAAMGDREREWRKEEDEQITSIVFLVYSLKIRSREH